MANEHRIRALDVVPEARRAWVEEDKGLRRLFEALDLAGPARSMSLQTAAAIAMQAPATLKRNFPDVVERSWGGFRREWRLLEAHRLLESPLVTPQQARRSVGLRSSGKFSAAFRKRFGVTPRGMKHRRKGTRKAD